MKNLKNLTKYEYVNYDGYEGNLDILNNLNDMLYEMEDLELEDKYICDIVSEIADNYVPIYNDVIWKEAAKISDTIEECMEELGGLMDNNLIRTFQYGIFRYNEMGLYKNLETIIYNLAISYLDSQFDSLDEYTKNELLKIDESEITYKLKSIDNGSYFSEIGNAMDELIESLKEE